MTTEINPTPDLAEQLRGALLSRQVVLWTATPSQDGAEFRYPAWQKLTADQNTARLAGRDPGCAICGNVNPRWAVVDVDTKNGGDVKDVEDWLARLGVTPWAKVRTPSGGAHFYINGSPTLADIYGSSSQVWRVIGLPGVEVFGRDHFMFLPGTQRPKYNGGGYSVEWLALDAVDADSEPLWKVLREAKGQAREGGGGGTATPQPPDGWDHRTDPRAARYLEHLLAGVAGELAATTAGSRNDQLNRAAFRIGQATLLTLKETEEALLPACQGNGLLQDDGEETCRATIRSGFNNGRENPVLTPANEPNAEGWTDCDEEDILASGAEAEPIDPVTLAEAEAVFTHWLGAEYDLDALRAVLAAAAVERLDGDPVWLLLISGPGNAKTETVGALSQVATITSTIASEGALLSATSRKERSKDATGGLLRKLGSSGVLVIKDVTSILSMDRTMRGAVLAALREVYDGNWSRNVGTDGGRTLTWKGRLTVVGAVTTAWDQAHSVISAMGDRFVLLRMDSRVGRKAAGRQAIRNTGQEVEMRAELARVVAGVLAGMRAPRELTEAEDDRLLAAADLVCLARTGVERAYNGEVIDAHAPEMPTRFAKQLAQVVRGALAVGMGDEDALRLAIRCARDSVPPLRLAIIDDVAAHPGANATDTRRRLDKPRTTVDREMQALHMLGVLTVDEVEGIWGSRPGMRWEYSLAEDIDPAVISLPEMLLPPHMDTKESSDRDGETVFTVTNISGDGPRSGRPHPSGWLERRCVVCDDPLDPKACRGDSCLDCDPSWLAV